MITEYYRPDNLEEALVLLDRKDPRTLPLAGGLFINEIIKDPIAVVDLQALGLGEIKKKGSSLLLGAAATLQSVLEADGVSPALQKAIKHQENYNRRQVATVAGSVVSCGGRSSIAGVFLALDAELDLAGLKGKTQKILLGDFLPLRGEDSAGRLITAIQIPTDVQTAYEYVARSPADLPIVGASVAQWASGRTRVVLMGYGEQPVMVFDGPEAAGAEIAARDAYSEAQDQWAGAAYRSEMAGVLVERCLKEIADKSEG